MTALLKGMARGLALAVVTPSICSVWLRARFMGRDKAFQGSAQWWSLAPGLVGEYLRRAFLGATCATCGSDAVVGFGTVFSTTRVRIEGNAYLGPHCDIGWALIERDALLAAGVHVPSGPDTHGMARLDIPMRDQPGTPRQIRIGEGAWIGNAAVVMADVGRHAIVAAGAVVTRPVPDFAIAAGVPARVIRSRRDSPEGAS